MELEQEADERTQEKHPHQRKEETKARELMVRMYRRREERERGHRERGRGGGETQTDKRGGTEAADIDDAVQAEQASWRTRQNVQQKTHGAHGEQEKGADAEGHQRYN